MDDPTLDDDQLLALLGAALDEMDPVPADAVATAHAAHLLRLDGELADLVFDSLVDDRAVGVRDAAAGEVRSLTFAAAGRTIEVDITDDDLVGRVTPPGTGLELVQPTGRTPVAADELGRFRVSLTSGPLRLALSGEPGPATTPWITR